MTLSLAQSQYVTVILENVTFWSLNKITMPYLKSLPIKTSPIHSLRVWIHNIFGTITVCQCDLSKSCILEFKQNHNATSKITTNQNMHSILYEGN